MEKKLHKVGNGCRLYTQAGCMKADSTCLAIDFSCSWSSVRAFGRWWGESSQLIDRWADRLFRSRAKSAPVTNAAVWPAANADEVVYWECGTNKGQPTMSQMQLNYEQETVLIEWRRSQKCTAFGTRLYCKENCSHKLFFRVSQLQCIETLLKSFVWHCFEQGFRVPACVCVFMWTDSFSDWRGAERTSGPRMGFPSIFGE